MVPEDVIYDDTVLNGDRVAVTTGLLQALGFLFQRRRQRRAQRHLVEGEEAELVMRRAASS